METAKRYRPSRATKAMVERLRGMQDDPTRSPEFLAGFRRAIECALIAETPIKWSLNDNSAWLDKQLAKKTA